MKILQVVPYFLPAYAFGDPVKVAYQISRRTGACNGGKLGTSGRQYVEENLTI